MSIKVEKRCYIAPASPSIPTTRTTTTTPTVELCAGDMGTQGMNVRLVLYFDEVINKDILKASLAKVRGGRRQ